MSTTQRQEYLAAKVNTANSAQLHLMLIEGALRFLGQADKALLREDKIASEAALVRVMEIIEELLAGVRHSTDEINQKLASLYEFTFTQVCLAYTNSDPVLLGEARKVLEFQRETWRLACDGLSSDSKKPAAIPTPHLDSAPVDSGVSFEV